MSENNESSNADWKSVQLPVEGKIIAFVTDAFTQDGGWLHTEKVVYLVRNKFAEQPVCVPAFELGDK